jgi:hypothetical protein
LINADRIFVDLINFHFLLPSPQTISVQKLGVFGASTAVEFPGPPAAGGWPPSLSFSADVDLLPLPLAPRPNREPKCSPKAAFTFWNILKFILKIQNKK